MSNKNKNTLTKQKVNKFNPGGWKDNWKGDKLGGTLATTVGGALNVATNAIQLAQPGNTVGYDTAVNNNKSIVDSIKNQKITSSTLGGINNQLSNINWGDVNAIKDNISLEDAGGPTGGEWATGILSGVASGAAAGSTIAPPIGTIVGGAIGGIASVIGLGSKAMDAKLLQETYKHQRMQTNAEIENAREALKESIINKKDEMAQNQINNFRLHNLNAYGGPLFNHTGDWSNGLTFIDEGGTHEQNPFEGVMVGVDQEGIPNLVEEGEVIFGDYVFSNRLKPTKKILADGGFSDKYVDWTFAKIAEDLQKESAERPVDFISNNTLEDMMSRLITFQEMVREKKRSNLYKNGGLVNKFKWGGGHQYETRKERKEALKALAEETAQLNALADKQAFSISIDARNKYRSMVDANTMPGMFDFLTNTDKSEEQSKFDLSTLGRYTPAAVNAISALYNATQKPDKLNYDHFDTAFDYAQNVPTINFTPITGEIKADLVDPNHLLNQHLAERASLNRAIKENAKTASTANMSLTSAAYSGQRNDAEALLTFDRENWNRKLQANQNNVGVRQYNSQGNMSAQQANMNRSKAIADAAFQNANARFGIDQFNLSAEAQKAQALSQSLGASAEDIAGIATENYWANEIEKNPAFMEYIAMMNKAKKSAKCGGMLTRKRRK